MRNIEIEIFPIASSQPNNESIRKWLDHVGAISYSWPQEKQNLTGAEAVIGLGAKRCYMSFEPGLNPNVNKVRKDWTDYFNNILKSQHGSVCEHASYTFAIEGVSRVFTGELNRHRAGVAISEGSMRYIRYNDIPWWMPPSIKLTNQEAERFHSEVLPEDDIVFKKTMTQQVFKETFKFCEQQYKRLVDIWQLDNEEIKFPQKKQITSCLRRIIPMGVATGGIWTFNIRALRHIIALRTTEHAEEEIAYVFSRIAKYICEKEPRLFGDFSQTEEGFWIPKYQKI